MLNYMKLWNRATFIRSIATVCVLCLCVSINSLRYFVIDIHVLMFSIVGQNGFLQDKAFMWFGNAS